MSGILSREIRFEKKGGKYRRFDWNRVNTALGPGWEPVSMDRFNANTTPDPNVSGESIDSVAFDADFKFPYETDVGADGVKKLLLVGGYCQLNRVRHYENNYIE